MRHTTPYYATDHPNPVRHDQPTHPNPTVTCRSRFALTSPIRHPSSSLCHTGITIPDTPALVTPIDVPYLTCPHDLPRPPESMPFPLVPLYASSCNYRPCQT